MEDTTGIQAERGLRLLALDDGGICGLSELIILEEMMKRIRHLEKLETIPRPCDYFDLIGGTGTGGLIALMLGKLHMSVGETITAYVRFTKDVFSEKKFGKTQGSVLKATKFEHAIKHIIISAQGRADIPMMDGQVNSICRCFVSAIPAFNMSQPRLFRTYEVRTNPSYNCTVWEAARATTAIPKLFKSISIGEGVLKEEFLGASFGWNNPITLVLREAESVFGPTQQVACVVSLGTGHPETIAWHTSGAFQWLSFTDLAEILKQICASCEDTAEELEQCFKNIPNIYFRLSVEQGMQRVSVADWQRLAEIKTHTMQYLELVNISQKIDTLASALSTCPKHITIGELNGPISIQQHKAMKILGISPPTSVFIGRENFLLQLDELFTTVTTSINLQKQRRCVLYGLGGAGKTQIALKFIQQYGDRFSNIYFIDASTLAGIELCFKTLAQKQATKATDATARAGLVLLSETLEEWLLIFDNADDPHINLQDFFPPCAHGNIIITTRNAACCIHAPKYNFEVAELSHSEATKLFFLTSGRPSDSIKESHLASEIVQELGHLALAIVQAGAYLMQDQGLGLGKYLDSYKKNRAKYHTLSTVQTVDGYNTPVYATWEMSHSKLTGPAAKLLQICACFHYSQITTHLFQSATEFLGQIPKADIEDAVKTELITVSAVEFLTSLQNEDGSWNEFEFRAIIQQLRAYSLIQSTGEDTYSMHPLVHAWAWERKKKTQTDGINCAAHILFCAIRGSENRGFKLSSLLALHLDQIQEKRAGPINGTREVWFASLYHAAEQWNKAEKLQLEAIKALDNKIEDPNPEMLSIQGNLATMYSDQGRYHEAEQLQLQLLETKKRLFGNEHHSTLTSMSNLALVYYHLGLYDKAEQLYVQVLEKRKKIAGDENLNTLIDMANLASTYSGQGLYHKAQQMEIQVVEARKRLLGEEHPDTLLSMSHLATTYFKLGLYEETRQLLTQTLEIRQRIFGNEHSSIAANMASLATLLSTLKQYDDAVQLYVQAVNMSKKIFGEEHPTTFNYIEGLSVTYSCQGKLDEAEKLGNQVLRYRKTLFSEDHPEVLSIMGNLAVTYGRQNKYHEAEELQTRVLIARKKVFGEDHPDTLLAMENLATNYAEQGDLEKGEQLQAEVVEANKRVLGLLHPNTLQSIDNLNAMKEYQLEMSTWNEDESWV